jgi:glycosyltransferase involved in cell wall biosynthesis
MRERRIPLRKELSILHVIRAPVGGAFRHVGDLARAQTSAGHSVGLVCDAEVLDALQQERLDALAAELSLGAARIAMTRSIGPGDLPATLRVVRHLAEVRSSVVHAHGAKAGVYGRVAAAIQNRRQGPVAAFYAPHGGSLHYDPRSLEGRVYFTVERALERVTDGLIHVSAYEAETYRRKVGVPRCPVHVVRNGLRPEEFAPVGHPTDAADFLFIGELRELKGTDLFIEALALLEEEGHAPRAVIVGPGTPEAQKHYREMANTGVKSRVAFYAPMSARSAFGLARNVVLPSRAESMPYVVLEAAACGMPLITTNVGGIPEIFAGEVERLVEPGSARTLADAMRAALSEPERLQAEAMLRRERVKQNFSLASAAGRIEDIYREALEARYSLMRAHPVAEADLPH